MKIFLNKAFRPVSLPFLLTACIRYHLLQYNSNLAKEIASNMYVNNIFLSTDNESEALNKCIKAKKTF